MLLTFGTWTSTWTNKTGFSLMPLSNSELNAALKGTKPLKSGLHADGRNLYLKVRPSGAMSWVFRYASNGRQIDVGLGSFTGAGSTCRLTLDDARMAADEVRAQIAKGVNVVSERKKAKRSTDTTFEAVLERYLTEAQKHWKVKNGVCGQAETWRSSLKEHAGSIMKRPVDEPDTDQVLAVLRPIWGRKIGEDVRQRMEKVFDAAKAEGFRSGMENPARYKGHLEFALGKKPKKFQKHHTALSADEVPAIIKQLESGDSMAARGLILTILTATRSAETRQAKWCEIDLEAKRWTIPAERMKAGNEHVVILSDVAVEFLKAIPKIDANPYVFAGRGNQPIGKTSLDDKLCATPDRGGLDMRGKATVHGFRATFRTWAKQQGFDNDACEIALAHQIGTDVSRAYQRDNQLVEERTKLMQAWGNFCMGKSNVVPMERAA